MSGPFKMKNPHLAASAKYKTPIQYSSPAKDGNEGDDKNTFVGTSEKYKGGVEIKEGSKFDRDYFIKQDNKERANEYLNSPEYKEKRKSGIEEHGSVEAYETSVQENAANKDKQGGRGATSYNDAVEVDFLQFKDRNREVGDMSKKELLQSQGKKTNLVNRIFSNKEKLKNKELGNISREYYNAKGSGFGQQALNKGDVRDVDVYSRVKEEEETKTKK